MTKHIEHSFSQDKMHILMPNTQQIMRDKLANSLKEFHEWADLIRSGEAEVTSMSIKRKPKTWVGLTDEDAQEVIEKSMQAITGGSNTFKISANSVWLAIVREVEAKLKEKNEKKN